MAGFYFRRRKRIAPGLFLNIGTTSAGLDAKTGRGSVSKRPGRRARGSLRLFKGFGIRF